MSYVALKAFAAMMPFEKWRAMTSLELHDPSGKDGETVHFPCHCRGGGFVEKKDGCLGSMPVSNIPTTTPLPALRIEPFLAFHAPCNKPKNLGVYVVAFAIRLSTSMLATLGCAPNDSTCKNQTPNFFSHSLHISKLLNIESR